MRYDRQVPGLGAYTFAAGPDASANPSPWSIFDAAVQSRMSEILPSVSIKKVGGNPYLLGGGLHAYRWNTWSPRIGLTWDIGGNGKTIAKLALSQYGDVMAGVVDVAPVEEDAALDPAPGDDVVHAVEGPDEGRLAAARRSDEGRDLAVEALDRDVLEGPVRPVVEIEVLGLDLDRVRCGAHRCFLRSRYRRMTAVMFRLMTRTIRTRAVP